MAECDTADGFIAVISLSNLTNGDTQFLCARCVSMFGVAMAKELFPDIVEAMVPAPVVDPPAPKKGRRKTVEPVAGEYDASRTVAAVTESAPRNPETDTEPLGMPPGVSMENPDWIGKGPRPAGDIAPGGADESAQNDGPVTVEG